jgi:DNA-binding beta-propeller fold protein YncE
MFRTVLVIALAAVGTLLAATRSACAQSSEAALRIEAKIPLGDVRGRIDHMAADVNRRRLFVAELGNNTVGIVDIGQGNVLQVLGGLKEPQGVGYLPSTDTLYVANGVTDRCNYFKGRTTQRMAELISATMRTMYVSISRTSVWWSAMVPAHWP